MSRNLDPQNRETAIRVLIGTKLVQNWVRGIMRGFDINPDSEASKKRQAELAREYASGIIDDRA